METILRGILGLCALIGVCYLFNNNRKAIDWKMVSPSTHYGLINSLI